MKLLKETYKTYDGAAKRCSFENGVAKGEFERGYKAKHYHYGIMQQGNGTYRVYRDHPATNQPLENHLETLKHRF